MTAVLRLGTLRVPGAGLHYQLRGHGPLLLIIMGGGGDADTANRIVEYLTERYTVMTYDRRGLSRSTLDDPDEHPTIEMHSEDVHRLLAEVSIEPVFVLGTSFGALIALDLIGRHPKQVHLLVAHEAPLPQMLPDSQRIEFARVQRAIEQGPGGPEWGEVMQKIGLHRPRAGCRAFSSHRANDRQRRVLLQP